MCECSQVSLKQKMLHSRYFLWVFTSAVSSSVLFPKDLTFPIMIASTGGLLLVYVVSSSPSVLCKINTLPECRQRRRDIFIEHSKFCVEGTHCSAIQGGVAVCGVIAESLLFLPVTVNNCKQWQPRWSSCICSWSLLILKNKCLNCKC